MNRKLTTAGVLVGAPVALALTMACRTPDTGHHPGPCTQAPSSYCVPSRPVTDSSTETAAPTSHPSSHGSYSSGHSTHTATPSKPCTTPAASSVTGVPTTQPATTPVSTRPPVVHTSTPALTTPHLTSASSPKGGIGTGAASTRPVPVLANTGSSAGQETALGLTLIGVGGLGAYLGRRRTNRVH